MKARVASDWFKSFFSKKVAPKSFLYNGLRKFVEYSKLDIFKLLNLIPILFSTLVYAGPNDKINESGFINKEVRLIKNFEIVQTNIIILVSQIINYTFYLLSDNEIMSILFSVINYLFIIFLVRKKNEK